jgi:hypothetical protein
MVNNVWNYGKLLTLSDSLMALRFTAISAVYAWECVHDLSAVGGSYQLH